MSFFGFVQVAKNLRTIFRQIDDVKADIERFSPDVIILIDYPAFNLRIAKWAKSRNIRVYYYIAPKVWAWKERRVKLIQKYVDKLFTIFPFESDYFRRWGIEPIFCGNPLVDAIESRIAEYPTREEFIRDCGLDNRPIIALVAGSRRSEINKNLPLMAKAAKAFGDYQFVVSGVEWLEKELYEKHLAGTDIRIVYDKTDALLKHSVAAIVTSGTATLEAALIGTPEVVVYRTDVLLNTLKHCGFLHSYISLVNINLQRECVAEIIQASMDSTRVEQELRKILPEGERREAMLRDFDGLRALIGGSGSSERTASEMVRILKEEKQ
jgi:lipid-A-disaccharide synthase